MPSRVRPIIGSPQLIPSYGTNDHSRQSTSSVTTTITTTYSPVSVYPETPCAAGCVDELPPVPSLPSFLRPENSHQSLSTPRNERSPSATNLSSRPPPLDFTLIHKLQSMPRDDMPVLSFTPSPEAARFRQRQSPQFRSYGSALSTPASLSTRAQGHKETPRSVIARLSTHLGILQDRDMWKAQKRVDKELNRMEKDRENQEAWQRMVDYDTERKGSNEDEENADWHNVGLREWSPLRVEKKSWTNAIMDTCGIMSGKQRNRDPKQKRGDDRRRMIVLVLIVIAFIVGLALLLYFLLKPKSSTSDLSVAPASIQTITSVVVSGTVSYLSTLTSTSTATIASPSTGISTQSLTSSGSVKPSSTSSSSSTSTSSSSSAPSASAAPVINLQTCLSSFPPSNQTTYCSDCYPFLSTASNDFVSNTGTSGVGKALQWCVLRSIFEATTRDSTGATTDVVGGALGSQGWFPSSGNGAVCEGWQGVNCDEDGRLVQLNLTYPAVPSVIPSSLGNIVTLQTLTITGNTVASIPSGSLPSSIYALSNLTSLSLTSTALDQAIPNTAFGQTGVLKSLTLIDNQGLGGSLPTGLGALNLTSLIATGQALSGDQITNLPSSLAYLDLSFNSLSVLPSSLSTILPSVRTLLLSSNSLTTIPTSFPTSIQSLSMKDNTGLAGQLPSDLCGSGALSICDVSGTKLTGSVTTTTVKGNSTTTVTSCGVCQF
ncbi:Leucine-rich repeat, typical subtype [Phaffia rhodozyma]|uniref:Leucine-rich repeat, typical subtype n=1 Tax=Phaffia rhodozyma TaxID=264483 RepID=A0A0F7SGQ3_PHARH|nr:Leucine-rich repeat, typical subtype [Phaffia rhodozyma]